MVEVVSPDNGGEVTVLAYTLSQGNLKACDENTNVMVLDMACTVS